MVSLRGHKLIIAFLTALTLSVPGGMPGVGAAPPAPADDNTRVVINIPSRTLWVYEGDKIVKAFPVGVGRPGFMTPMGQFSIIRKIVDPGWEHPYLPSGKVRIAPGENNPLGTRWMGFYQKNGGEYGMHGTDEPTSVGKFSSHGCVRMKVHDAETLFDLVDIGTPVDIIYDPVLIRPQSGDLRIIVYRDVFKKGLPTADKLKAKILSQYPNAQVDMTKVRNALMHPVERPVAIGKIKTEPDNPVAGRTSPSSTETVSRSTSL